MNENKLTKSATKNIWAITFQSENSKSRIQNVAAYDLLDALSYFNMEGLKKIVKIEKLSEEITYSYC